jgi:hypothetical protein
MEESTPTTVLDRDDCLDRLSAAPLARILVSVKCLPTALPARIQVVNRDHIVISSSDSTILLAAQRHDVLTVQVDGVDESNHPWSVVASGIAEVTTPVGDLSDTPEGPANVAGPVVSFPVSVVVGQRH